MRRRTVFGRSLCLASLALMTGAWAVQAQDTAATLQPSAALPPPPGGEWQPVVTGRLANGVRFAILPRRDTEPGVGLLMRIEGGFIAERRPGERGVAHLIEHIVFSSPTTKAPDDLHHFPHIGLQVTFPAPAVATTTWRESNFFVSTRTTHIADLDTMLALFREAASDLTLRADAVDAERASVLREMADKKPGNALYASYIAAVAPGSPTDVIDAQNSDDVGGVSIGTIRALYHRLYRPENTMIVVVGNVDPAQIAGVIRQRFGTWRGIGPAPARVAPPRFQPGRIAPISYANAQDRRTTTITVATPLPAPPETRAGQAEATLMDMVAVRAATDRLARGHPASDAAAFGVNIEHGEQGHRLIMLWDNVFPAGKWQPPVARLRKTTCDLATTGWSEAEWAAARQAVIADLERQTGEMARVPNVELAKDLSHALADGRTLVPPDDLLRYARTWLTGVDARAANGWWRRQWRTGVEHLRVETPVLAEVQDPESAIRAAADAAVADPRCKVRADRRRASREA